MPPPQLAMTAELKLRRKEKLLRALQRLNDSATQKAASEELLIIINVMAKEFYSYDSSCMPCARKLEETCG